MNPLLVEGLSDAIGFVAGALLGFWIGRLLGLDIFAAGYGAATTDVVQKVGKTQPRTLAQFVKESAPMFK